MKTRQIVTRKRKPTRAEKHEETFRALITAAIEVVGEEGYAAASITKIALHAKIANGTFYNYFESRQDLFDQLLPLVGDRLIDHIRKHTDKNATGLERERMRIAAYLDFLRVTPGFIRIFHEAEVYAPRAYERHMNQYFTGYVDSLKKSISRGEVAGFSEDDIPALAFLLMGMRDFMATMIMKYPNENGVIDRIIDTYLRLISRGGLYSVQETK